MTEGVAEPGAETPSIVCLIHEPLSLGVPSQDFLTDQL